MGTPKVQTVRYVNATDLVEGISIALWDDCPFTAARDEREESRPLSLLGANVFRGWVDHRFEVWEEEGEALSAQEINLKEIFQKTCDGLVRDGVYINLDNPKNSLNVIE
jgi:hypothetical protein